MKNTNVPSLKHKMSNDYSKINYFSGYVYRRLALDKKFPGNNLFDNMEDNKEGIY